MHLLATNRPAPHRTASSLTTAPRFSPHHHPPTPSPPRSGPLPNPEAGQFPRLRIIDVNSNRFSGTLGDGWAQTGLFRLVSPVAA